MNPPTEAGNETTDLALKLMIAQLGDGAFDEMEFDPEDASLRDVSRSAWKSLEEDYFVKALRTQEFTRYVLTARGWLRGMELAGTMAQIKASAGRVMDALKAKVQERSGEVSVYASEIAKTAGVSVAFITNITQSNFISTVLGKKGMKGERYLNDMMLWVPVDFGRESLDKHA